MQFTSNNCYHIYNRGNNKQPIFFNRNNYLYFLRKVRKSFLPYSDILSYCLMPNHFHFLVKIKELLSPPTFKQTDIKESIAINGSIITQTARHPLTTAIGLLLSSYSQAINKQNGTTGSLFQQKTKAKHLDHPELIHTVFHYIHQNPLACGLINKIEDWEFSSFPDYAGFRNGTLCNQQLVFELLPFLNESFYVHSYQMVEEKKLKEIF